jgi:hypothetical protein
MLLSEQVRRLPNEKNLINDAAGYSRNACGWAQIKNYGNITLTQDSIVILTYAAAMFSNGGGGHTCAHRIKVGGLDVSGFQFVDGGSVSENVVVIFFLAAGTYAVTADGAGEYYDINNYRTITVSNFKLGVVDFSDVVGFSVAAYSTTITKNLPARKLAIGTIKNGVMHIQITTNNVAAVASLPTVSVDGVTLSWTWSKTTQAAGYSCNSYGSVCGRIDIPLTAGADHTITLSGGAGTHYISIAFTPWILPTSLSEPVTLDFPQGSTLYITTEPLVADPTKDVKIGKARAISFGDTTDYYSTTSGTGILNCNYTFETVEVANCVLLVDGYGGCISIIGVDVR